MEELPDLLVVTSLSMKEQFEQFGQWVYFDTTYNIIRDVLPGNKRFKVGLFVGLNSARKIIPFGWCILIDETAQAFYKAFKAFFDMMGKQPGVMLTDEGLGIKAAIKELK